MPITKKPEPDYYLSVMREIAVSLKSQLLEYAKKNDEKMLSVYNVEAKINPLIKINNQINLMIPLLSIVIGLPDDDDLPFETALKIKNFPNSLSDYDFPFNVKKDLSKIIQLEIIRTPELKSAFQHHDSGINAHKQLQIKKIARAERKADEEKRRQQAVIEEQEKFERQLNEPKSQCIIC